jgi:hypothetical protein
MEPNKEANFKRIAIIGACCLAFGLLMGLRSDFEQHWAKNVLAGLAFAFMGLGIALAQKYRGPRKPE